MIRFISFIISLFIAMGSFVRAQAAQEVVDIPTRTGVTQRFLVIAPQAPKAAVILFTGGNGALQLDPQGSMKQGKGNFLIRTRQQFADHELLVIAVDAPSDRQSGTYLGGFRQTSQHVEDIKAVMAWVHARTKIPIWLVGTSRGTQSAAFIATQLTGPEGPDGLVLTSTILKDDAGRAVPKMELDKIRIPVFVVHHEQDGCKLCAFSEIPSLMNGLTASRKKELLAVKGGQSQGDPCEARAYHGYNGIEREVVDQTAKWILAN